MRLINSTIWMAYKKVEPKWERTHFLFNQFRHRLEAYQTIKFSIAKMTYHMVFLSSLLLVGVIGLVPSILLTKLGVNKIRLSLVLPFFVFYKILSVVGLIQDDLNPVVLRFHVIIFVFCFWFFRYLLFCLCFGVWGECTLTIHTF